MIGSPGPHGYDQLGHGPFMLILALIAAGYVLVALTYWRPRR